MEILLQTQKCSQQKSARILLVGKIFHDETQPPTCQRKIFHTTITIGQIATVDFILCVIKAIGFWYRLEESHMPFVGKACPLTH
jgi:hypothetical protein